ncbi:hypothetical protein KA089_01785 [Candidatus Woesebacteria bacterium]|nr:hypothetical protein [Candidatus Woesebacteria bacterium]
MKIIQTSQNSFFKNIIPAYFRLRKLLKGSVLREIRFTMYDKETSLTSWGFIYISTKNTIINIEIEPEINSIVEIEPIDHLEVVNESAANLKEVLTDKHSETYFRVNTTNPIAYLQLNNRYLLLLNIQSDRKYGSAVSGAVSNTILTGKNYVEKVENTRKSIIESVQGNLTKPYLPIHGLSPTVMWINIILSEFFLFGTLATLVYLLFN